MLRWPKFGHLWPKVGLFWPKLTVLKVFGLYLPSVSSFLIFGMEVVLMVLFEKIILYMPGKF